MNNKHLDQNAGLNEKDQKNFHEFRDASQEGRAPNLAAEFRRRNCPCVKTRIIRGAIFLHVLANY